MIRSTFATLTLALAGSLLVASPPTAAAAGPRAAANPDDRPNLVLITSDDQADTDLDYMPRTRRLLTAAGIDFTDGMNPHPLCCPGRAEILTGEYAHNNGVRQNRGEFGGYDNFLATNGRGDQIGKYLSDAGYKTALIGKMMNGYDAQSPEPAGFDFWSPTLRGTYSYYDTTFLNDGTGAKRDYPNKYVADVVRDLSIDKIDQWSGPAKAPFFLWASHVGPHIGQAPDATQEAARVNVFADPIPADRHVGMFDNEPLPQRLKPSFNAGAEGKSDATKNYSTERSAAAVTEQFQRRIESLQAIDEANADMINALARNGELDNTVIVYASDNGWQYGEHSLLGKNFPYQENLQIPFLMRAPDAAPGQVSTLAPTLVDIAPTFLSYAGALNRVRSTTNVDGLNLRQYLAPGSAMPNDTSLIQAGSLNFPWLFRGARTSRYTWVTFPAEGQFEMYDRVEDPFELNNLLNVNTGEAKDPRYAPVAAEMERRFRALGDCRGTAECESQDFGAEPVPIPAPVG